MIRETIISADYHEIEKIARRVFKDEGYSFPATQECSNDTSHRFDVDANLDEYDTKEVEEMLEDNRIQIYRNREVLNYLAQIGEIETGTYVIEVSW